MKTTIALGVAGLISASAGAGVVSYTEDFEGGSNGWLSGAFSGLTEVGSGALDGSAYVSTQVDLNTAGPFGITLFRGHDDFDASGDAFVGEAGERGAMGCGEVLRGGRRAHAYRTDDRREALVLRVAVVQRGAVLLSRPSPQRLAPWLRRPIPIVVADRMVFSPKADSLGR